MFASLIIETSYAARRTYAASRQTTPADSELMAFLRHTIFLSAHGREMPMRHSVAAASH